jgi:hypothetical protein
LLKKIARAETKVIYLDPTVTVRSSRKWEANGFMATHRISSEHDL